MQVKSTLLFSNGRWRGVAVACCFARMSFTPPNHESMTRRHQSVVVDREAFMLTIDVCIEIETTQSYFFIYLHSASCSSCRVHDCTDITLVIWDWSPDVTPFNGFTINIRQSFFSFWTKRNWFVWSNVLSYFRQQHYSFSFAATGQQSIAAHIILKSMEGWGAGGGHWQRGATAACLSIFRPLKQLRRENSVLYRLAMRTADTIIGMYWSGWWLRLMGVDG